jgi:hypothetical protein
MAISDGSMPTVQGINFEAQQVRAAAAQGASNSIAPGSKVVEVTGVTVDANDFVVLPPLSSVQNGHEILILANAGANFELRTPSASAEEINSEDCDGTKELLVTNTTLVKVTKINNTIGWMSNAYTAIGAVQTAVVPD